MNKIGNYFFVGVAVIAAVYLFRTQEKIGETVIERVKTKDVEQIAIASAITVGLGIVAVIGADLLRSKK